MSSSGLSIGNLFDWTKAFAKTQIMPWQGSGSTIENLALNPTPVGGYRAMYEDPKNEKDAQSEAEQKANDAALAAQEAAQEAAAKKAAADALTAAATAEAEKLRKRKGFKATNLTGTNKEALGGVVTEKATMMG